MISKIVITGLPECNKTLLALSLANITDIPYTRSRTIYEWCRCCNVSDFSKLKWKDMFFIASASFFENVKTESYFDRFISDESSLRELICLKSFSENQNETKMKIERNKIVQDLEIVSARHALQQYDFVVHLNSDNDKYFSDLYLQLYEKYNIPYRLYTSVSTEEIIREITGDSNLPVRGSVENSIYQAKHNLFMKNDSYISRCKSGNKCLTPKILT